MIELVIRLVFSLAIVVGLVLLLAKFAGRRYKGRTGATIQVVHRQQLTRGSSVSVVTVGTRVLVVGATDHQVSLLTELDPDELEIAEAFAAPADARELADLDEPEDGTSLDATERPRGGVPTAVPTSPEGGLSGSVLSPQTWRDAFTAVSGRRSR